MMAAVGAGHIAQQVGLGADPMQIDRHRVVGRRIALQHQPDRAIEADRGLRRGDRALAAERHRQHRARKQHEVARGDQDQRIGGKRRNPGQRLFNGAGRRRRCGFRRAQFMFFEGICRSPWKGARWRALRVHHSLCSCTIRQPLARCRPEISNGPAAARCAARNARAGSPADESAPAAIRAAAGARR